VPDFRWRRAIAPVETAQWVAFGVALLFMAVGIAGTVVPVLPGVPLIWLAILGFGFVDKFRHVDTTFLVVTALVVVASEAMDYVTRAWGAKRFGAGHAGTLGAVLGAVAGLFFLPVGLLLGPFLGALIGELLSGRPLEEALRAGWGGLLGTLGSVVVKFVVAVAMTIAFVIKVL
jgi:Uncharacterized protein conserved in bacteria